MTTMKTGIPIRQPIAEVFISVRTLAEARAVYRNKALILDELNAKAMVIVGPWSVEELKGATP